MRSKQEHEMELAILSILNRFEYPSAVKIANILHPNNLILSGKECILRRKIFKRLNIKLRKNGYK